MGQANGMIHYQYFHLIFVEKHHTFLKKLPTTFKFINKKYLNY